MYEFFFAQLFGLYFMIIGLIVMVRQKSIMPVMNEFFQNRVLMFFFPLLELAAGLALVLTYPTISASISGVVSLVGWMMLVESVFYLTMPHQWLTRLMKKFNTASWYTAGGAISIVLGAYLAIIGFGVLL